MSCSRYLLVLATCFSVVSCGGSNAEHGGQSSLIEKTFAGANRCNPKNHERPFVIEWDATDMSSFQAFAANDVVFVNYEGCDLQVLDGCRDDSLHGALGSYRPVTWTSGSLEAMDIGTQQELYAKLPLGAATLAPRVQNGEQFHMEYYVSGTRTATREAVYRADLAKNPACQTATHFVYGYNLGAFALGSRSKLSSEVGGSYFGFGAGATSTTSSRAEKKGGNIAACTGDSAREVDTCKVPIRLTLRPVTDGANPDADAARVADSDASLNLAGKVQASADRQFQADQHAASAHEKQVANDGAACLAELDQHDVLDPTPTHLSTNPKGGELAHVRASCMMLAGQCDAGRAMTREILDAEASADVDRKIDVTVATYCRSSTAAPRDQWLHAKWVLEQGSIERNFTPAECQSAYATAARLRPTMKATMEPGSQGPDDWDVHSEAWCVARAGDCALAMTLWGGVCRPGALTTHNRNLCAAQCSPASSAKPADSASSPTARPDVEPGWLDISSDPPAEIFVDDADTKTVTPQHHISLPAGHHLLRLVTADGARERRTGFGIEAGKGMVLTLRLAAP